MSRPSYVIENELSAARDRKEFLNNLSRGQWPYYSYPEGPRKTVLSARDRENELRSELYYAREQERREGDRDRRITVLEREIEELKAKRPTGGRQRWSKK